MLHLLTRSSLILFIFLVMLLPAVAPALEEGIATPPLEESIATSPAELQLQDTINTLHSLIKLQIELKQDIQALNQQLATAETAADKRDIQTQLDKLDADLQTTNRNLKGIGGRG
mgnify:FL=1